VGTNEFLAATCVQTDHIDDTGNGFGSSINGGYNWMSWDNNIVTGVVFDANGLTLNISAASPLCNYTWQRQSDEIKAGVRQPKQPP